MEYLDETRREVVAGSVPTLVHGRFEWAIEDFLSISFKVYSRPYGWSKMINSPYFSFAAKNYYIRVMLDKDEDRVSLSIHTAPDTENENVEPPQVHVKFEMRTVSGRKLESRRGIIGDSRTFDVYTWMTRSEMLERRCEILHNGRLTIYCKLNILESERNEPEQVQGPLANETKPPEENEASDSDSDNEIDSNSEESVLQSKSSKKVLKELKNLLTSAEDSDVVIKIQGKVFPAHRGILRMRSPVFKSMFSHDMVEKETGVVEIEDCDPLTFPDFLNHVYTGSTKHVCAENALSLYSASDKYDMQELKEACALFMRNNFSVDTFCDVIVLALHHSDNPLIESATDFFCTAATEIIRTPKWIEFLHENTEDGNKLLDRALSNSENI